MPALTLTLLEPAFLAVNDSRCDDDNNGDGSVNEDDCDDSGANFVGQLVDDFEILCARQRTTAGNDFRSCL